MAAFRGASAESLETLTGLVGQAVSGGADSAGLAEELFAVAGVLGGEAQLRRVLTDQSVDGEAKAGLARSILTGKVGEVGLGLIAQAVSLRWTNARDLGNALEELGVIALVKGAESAGESDRLEDELFGFGQVISGNPELRAALTDRTRSSDDRTALATSLLAGKALPSVVRLVEQALRTGGRHLEATLASYQTLAAAQRSQLTGVVRVAKPLSADDKTRLETALARQYGSAVRLNVIVDPAVIGGIKVELGDDVIDGTVANRLDDARRRLAG